MKKLMLTGWLFTFLLSATFAQSDWDEYQTGFEGDYFSLQGAIELFKQSRSIKDFERRLNREDTWVNNLDLNYDGEIDFIRVEHIRQGNYHAIVLQVPFDRYDVQDIAVIEIEKVGRRRAMLQIVGDEDIYGEEVIVEPVGGNGYSSGRGGPSADFDFRRGYVNVFYWSAVQCIFGRNYRVYSSPYRWSYYPTWWRPWRPCGWNVFRPRVVVYHRHYHVVHVHRVHRVHHIYRPRRATCYPVLWRSNQVRVERGKSPVSRPAVKKRAHHHDLKKVNRNRPGVANVSKKPSKLDRNGKTAIRPQKADQVSRYPRNSKTDLRPATRTDVQKRPSSSTRGDYDKVKKQRNGSVGRSGKTYEPKQRGNTKSRYDRSPATKQRSSSASRSRDSASKSRSSSASRSRGSASKSRSSSASRSRGSASKPRSSSASRSRGSASKSRSSSASRSRGSASKSRSSSASRSRGSASKSRSSSASRSRKSTSTKSARKPSSSSKRSSSSAKKSRSSSGSKSRSSRGRRG